MWDLRRCEQPPQYAEMWRGHRASALPPCFKAGVALPRLLFLVSPTCEICVAGAMSAAHTVLSLSRTAAFRLYILWLPVLEADTLQAAEHVRGRLPGDDRMRHFWDHDLELSRAYYRVCSWANTPVGRTSRGTSFCCMMQAVCGTRTRRCQPCGCTTCFWRMCPSSMRPS